MTSNDNAPDMAKLELLLREHFARTDKQLSDMRAENAEFRVQMMKEQREFEARQEAKFDTLTSAVVELQRDVEGLKHNIAGLYHHYWLWSIVLVVFAMPQIAAGVKSLFLAITEGIAGIISLFRQKGD